MIIIVPNPPGQRCGVADYSRGLQRHVFPDAELFHWRDADGPQRLGPSLQRLSDTLRAHPGTPVVLNHVHLSYGYQTVQAAPVLIALVARLLRRPVYVIWHEGPAGAGGWRGRLRSMAARPVRLAATGHAASAEPWCQVLGRKAVIAPIPSSFEQASPPTRSATGRPYLAFLGIAHEGRRLDRLALDELIDQLRTSAPGLGLRFAGPGWADVDLPPEVEPVGEVADDEVRSFLGNAVAFVAPVRHALGPKSSSASAALEAGTPVVECGAAQGLPTPGARRFESITEAGNYLAGLASDLDRRATAAAEARSFYERERSWAVVAKALSHWQ